MSAHQVLTTINMESDAIFRDWGLAISQKLAAVGLVKVTATGQVNWATVVRPGGVNTKAGFEIWRFNDALQDTAPVFIRLDFGTGDSASPLSPRMWIQVGTTHDGAGVLGGVVSAPLATDLVNTSGETFGAGNRFYLSGANNRVSFVMIGQYGITSTRVSSTFLVERLKSSTGTDLATAFGLIAGSTTVVLPADGLMATPETKWGCQVSTNNPQLFNNKMSIGLPVLYNGDAQRPVMGLAIVRDTDFLLNSLLTANVYGVARTYIFTQVGKGNSGSTFTHQGNVAVLIRWE